MTLPIKKVMFLAAMGMLAMPIVAQSLPLTHGTSLAGQAVTLPADLHARRTVLILGFTQKSAAPSTAWGERVENLMMETPGVVCLQIPVLESVPRWLRGMVVHDMKKNIPANLHGTFVPVFEREAEWKQVVGFSAPDDAYVVVADAQGRVVWQVHGAVTDAQVRELKAQLKSRE